MSISRWMYKMWYVCSMEYYSDIKNNEKLPWVNLEIITLSEVSQTKTSTIRHHYTWNLKHDTNLFTKQKQSHRHESEIANTNYYI